MEDPKEEMEEDLEEGRLLDQIHLEVLVPQQQSTIQLHIICHRLLLKDKCILEIINHK